MTACRSGQLLHTCIRPEIKPRRNLEGACRFVLDKRTASFASFSVCGASFMCPAILSFASSKDAGETCSNSASGVGIGSASEPSKGLFVHYHKLVQLLTHIRAWGILDSQVPIGKPLCWAAVSAGLPIAAFSTLEYDAISAQSF